MEDTCDIFITKSLKIMKGLRFMYEFSYLGLSTVRIYTKRSLRFNGEFYNAIQPE